LVYDGIAEIPALRFHRASRLKVLLYDEEKVENTYDPRHKDNGCQEITRSKQKISAKEGNHL